MPRRSQSVQAARGLVELPHRLGDDPWELLLEVPGARIVGGSVAAVATAFLVEPFGVAVDLGRCSARLAEQPTILLTHCHADHIAGLIAWLAARSRRPPGTACRIVVPAARREALLAALAHWPDLDRVRRRIDLGEAVLGAVDGQEVELDQGGRARAFAVHHGVPSLGWQVFAPGQTRSSVVFAADGTVLPFRERPGLLDAEVAVVECSFVEPGSRVAARLGGHAHLADWLELLPELGCDRLVLTHLPAETTCESLVRRLCGLRDSRTGPRLVAWLSD